MNSIYEQIKSDLEKRDTGLQKPHIKGIATIVSSLLVSRSPNLMMIGEMLNRNIVNIQDRYQYVRRFLKNQLIKIDETMTGYITEVLTQLGQVETVILMLDQSKISDGFECLMVSVRVGARALPVLWRVKEQKGNVGFETQKELLDAIFKIIPTGLKVILMADRFYGTSALVGWCKSHDWGYRIRLRGNLHFHHQGGLIVSGDCLKLGLTRIENAVFNETTISTNIGIIHESGHPEPWIIAMDCKPSDYTTLDYGLRWGIEAMFSDFKSRGFSITDTHLIHEDRIERLIMIIAIALFWAVSTGMTQEHSLPIRAKKNDDRLFHFLPGGFGLS